MTFEEIHNKIKQRKYSFSDHSVKRMIKRNVTRQEVEDRKGHSDEETHENRV